MESGIFEIELTDGRTFRVAYLNSSQKKRVLKAYFKIKDKCNRITSLTNGIHTVAQFETIFKN